MKNFEFFPIKSSELISLPPINKPGNKLGFFIGGRESSLSQKRGVQVFKLVTKNSVEEHIHALIERKRGLAESIIGYDDQDQLKTLSREELVKLLERLNLILICKIIYSSL